MAGKEFYFGRSASKDRVLVIDIRMLAGGKRKTPWVAVYNEEEKIYERVWDYNRAYDEKMKDYMKADLRIMYRLNKKGVTQEWGIDISNLFNYRNLQSERFNEITGETAPVYQQA